MKKVLTAIASLAIITPVVAGSVVACDKESELDKLNKEAIGWLNTYTKIPNFEEITTDEQLKIAMESALKVTHPSEIITVDKLTIDKDANKITYTLALNDKTKEYTYTYI